MLINNIEISGFIPLSHSDIKTLTVKVTSPIQLIIGANGSGKSSILNELTKTCSSKPMYNKKGYRIVSGYQDNIEYKLVSDFRVKNSHDLIKNTDSLNISGTTNTQIDLCKDNLGLTPIVDKLINFKYKICSMPKGERKQFFLSVHPSDLSFILNDHKRISSELRGFKSNLKMLKERQLTLNNKLIDPSQLKELYKLRDQLQKDQNILDKIIYMTNHEINSLKNSNNTTHQNGAFFSLETLKKKCSDISKLALVYRDSHPYIFDIKSLENQTSFLETELHKKDYSKQQLLETADIIKNEILELEETNTNVEVELHQLRNEVCTLNELISVSQVNPNIPVVNNSELDYIENELLPKVEILVADVVSCNSTIISLKDIDKLKSSIKDLEFNISGYNETISRLNRAKSELVRRREKESKYTFPIDCDMACELKTNTVSILKRTDDEIQKIDDEISKLKEDVSRDSQVLKSAHFRAKNISEMECFLVQFEQLFKNHFWIGYIFKDKKLTEILNNNPSSIINNLILICNNTKAFNCKTKYENQLKVTKAKLETLQNMNLPTKELISKTLIDKQLALDIKLKSYTRLKIDIINITNEIKIVNNLQNFKTTLHELYDQLMVNCQIDTIKALLELYAIIIKDSIDNKNITNSTLREIESTIHEQENYQVRLNDEILPSISEIELKIKQWEQVEKTLSPSKGLPHIYMVRYLNNTILNVNKLLSNVCGSDLKINKIDPNKSLEFNLGVTVRGEYRVSDISKCSAGQQQMIDLVWNIVTCQQLGLNKRWPLFLDEIDSNLTEGNRLRLLELLSKLVQQGDISQLFLINHVASLQGMKAEVLCLNPEGVALPHIYNEHVTIN